MIANLGASKLVPVGKLQEHPRNVNEGDVGAIHESITHNGFYGALVVQQSTGYVLVGNHRLRAATAAGLAKVPVFYVDVDDEQALKILLADNRTAELATRDEAALAALLQEIAESTGLEGTGYDGDDLDEMIANIAANYPSDDPYARLDKADELREQWGTADGQVWKVGSHRIICGDATDPATLLVLMDGDQAPIVVTSPPYNQRLDGFKPSGMQAENPAWVTRMASAYADSMDEDDYQAQQIAMVDGLLAITTPTASLFYNHKHRYRDKAVVSPMAWLTRTRWRIRQEIVWDRASSITLNARMFMPVDERIYWMTRGDDFTFNDTTDVKAWGTVWQIAPKAETGVTAPFPVELPTRCVAACSSHGDIVLDPYAGSGTTIVACEQTGRRGYGIELDPRYVAVTLQRLHDMGLTPVLQQ